MVDVSLQRALCLIVISTLLLTACGFQLRSNRLPVQITEPVEVSPAQTETAKRLADALQAQGVATAVGASMQLRLENERRDKRAIALTSRATVAEYRLSHRLWVSLHNQDQLIIPPTLIEARRTLVVRPAEAAGMEQEELLLVRELEAEILDRILRWLSYSLTDALPGER